MGNREELALHCGTIAVGATAVALGDPSGATLTGVSIWSLSALALGLGEGAADRARKRAQNAVLTAIDEAAPEFGAEELALAAELLKLLPDSPVSPRMLARLSQHGNPVEQVAEALARQLASEQAAVQRLLALCLSAGLEAMKQDSEFRAALTLEAVLAAAESQGIVLARLHDIHEMVRDAIQMTRRLEARVASPPTQNEFAAQWEELMAHLRTQSNLPYEVQKRKATADAAIAAKDYDLARAELRENAADLRNSARYQNEEYARALAALGALAFTENDFVEARVQYGEAIAIHPLEEERLRRYQRSYLIASNACMAGCGSEAGARAIMAEMQERLGTEAPNVITYSTLLSFAKDEAGARAIMAEMQERLGTEAPNVFTYNTLLSFAKDEAGARAIMAEMQERLGTEAPNVITYSTLLTKLSGEKKILAVLRLMRRKGCSPNEITVINAIRGSECFEAALRIVDFVLAEGWFAGRGAFEAIFSKPIDHVPAVELLAQYHARKYKFDTSLGNPIRQYRRTGQHEQALWLTLTAPHIERPRNSIVTATISVRPSLTHASQKAITKTIYTMPTESRRHSTTIGKLPSRCFTRLW